MEDDKVHVIIFGSDYFRRMSIKAEVDEAFFKRGIEKGEVLTFHYWQGAMQAIDDIANGRA